MGRLYTCISENTVGLNTNVAQDSGYECMMSKRRFFFVINILIKIVFFFSSNLAEILITNIFNIFFSLYITRINSTRALSSMAFLCMFKIYQLMINCHWQLINLFLCLIAIRLIVGQSFRKAIDNVKEIVWPFEQPNQLILMCRYYWSKLKQT